MAEIKFEKYVPTVKEPELLSVVRELENKGDGIIAAIEVDSEEAAQAFLYKVRVAARYIGKSARKRVYEVDAKSGKVKVGIALGDKIVKKSSTDEEPNDVTDDVTDD